MTTSVVREGQAVPASDLIKAGLCSPQCMLAVSDHSEDGCRCRCSGAWHGVLADVPVQADVDLRPWWEKCNRAGWGIAEIEAYVPVCNSAKQRDALWKRSSSACRPYLMVNQSDEGWRIVHDHGTLPYRFGDVGLVPRNGWLVNGAGDLALRFLADLLGIERIRSAGPPPGEHVFAHGIKSREEAQMIGLLLGECFVGTLSGMMRAICVLEGHKDPLELGLMPKPYLEELPVPLYPWYTPGTGEPQ